MSHATVLDPEKRWNLQGLAGRKITGVRLMRKRKTFLGRLTRPLKGRRRLVM